MEAKVRNNQYRNHDDSRIGGCGYLLALLTSLLVFIFIQICLINDPRPAHDYKRLYTVQYLGNMKEGYPVRYINLSCDDLKRFTIASLKVKDVSTYCQLFAFMGIFILTSSSFSSSSSSSSFSSSLACLVWM